MHIFFHIPKAAGTNFANKLIAATGALNPLKIVRPVELAYMPDSLINEKDFVYGHFGVTFLDRIKVEKKTYTVLRDPISKVISHYKYMVKLNQQGMIGKSEMINFIKNASKEGLKEILMNKEIPYIEGAFRNNATWTFIKDGSANFRWLADDEKLLEIAKRNLAKVDFIGLVEDMEATFELLSSRLGVPVKNDTTENNSNEIDFEVDDELIELIKDNNRLDIDFYSWGRKLFFDRYSQLMDWPVLTPNNFSGEGWKNGVRTEDEKNVFYYLSTPHEQNLIKVGDLLIFEKTGPAKVAKVETVYQKNNLSVFVTVDHSLDPEGDGFPNRVSVHTREIRST